MKSPMRSTLLAVLATAGLGLSSAAFAQNGGNTYPSERAVCGHNQQDKAACLREAGAAQDAARRGALTDPPPDQLVRNALARCDRQPEADRRACQDRVRGSGQSSIDGSVMGGGLLRETVTPIPADMAPIPTSTLPPPTMPRATLPPASMPMPDSEMRDMPPATMPRSTMPAMPAMPSTLPPPPATMPPPATLPPR